jgi:hypothetical protein
MHPMLDFPVLLSTTLSQADLFRARFSGKGVVNNENFSSQ